MKPHRILKTFDGNQTGTGPNERFVEGTVADLSDHLAEVAVKGGLAEPVTGEAGQKQPDGRETKVAGPQETKPLDITKLNKKQILEFAKANHGLDLDESLKKDELLAAIDKQVAEKAAAA
jgi:hypothetical protein